MRFLEPKSAVSFAPIGNPNMHPRKYTINTSCFWETLYKIPDSKRRLVNMVNIITNLECLLKLPITFPVSLELCLEEELNNLKKKAGENHGRVAK